MLPSVLALNSTLLRRAAFVRSTSKAPSSTPPSSVRLQPPAALAVAESSETIPPPAVNVTVPASRMEIVRRRADVDVERERVLELRFEACLGVVRSGEPHLDPIVAVLPGLGLHPGSGATSRTARRVPSMASVTVPASPARNGAEPVVSSSAPGTLAAMAPDAPEGAGVLHLQPVRASWWDRRAGRGEESTKGGHESSRGPSWFLREDRVTRGPIRRSASPPSLSVA